jgi:hypothetical protein
LTAFPRERMERRAEEMILKLILRAVAGDGRDR